jgi:hypothetical protein
LPLAWDTYARFRRDAEGGLMGRPLGKHMKQEMNWRATGFVGRPSADWVLVLPCGNLFAVRVVWMAT